MVTARKRPVEDDVKMRHKCIPSVCVNESVCSKCAKYFTKDAWAL